MTSLAWLVLLSLASSTDALRVNSAKATPEHDELKVSEREREVGTAEDSERHSDASILSQEAELDQEEREFESAMLKSFKASDELVSAWQKGIQGSKLMVSKMCEEDISMKKMEHPECADPWPKTQNCEKPYEVPAYRIGDSFWEDHTSNPKFMKFYFPESIAVKYMTSPDKSYKADEKTMLKVISGPEYADYEKPSSKTVVVHLRLGDALMKNKEYMLRGIGYYEDFAKKMKQMKLNEVVLVTGDHKIQQRATLSGEARQAKWVTELQQMTQKRMKQVEKAFKKEGITVNMRVNHNADCDLIYMSNAKFFVVAGGTYSRLISMMVNLKGGQVWGKN